MFGMFKDKAPAIPLLDGPLSSNDLLEEAQSIQVADPEDMCVAADGALLVSSGNSILRLADWKDGKFDQVAGFESRVSALACREDGTIGVGLEGKGVLLISKKGTPRVTDGEAGLKFTAARACRFSGDGTLIVADACAGDSSSYLEDLFMDSQSGRLARFRDDGSADLIADGLQFPHGLVETGPDTYVITESWAKNLNELSVRTSVRKPVLKDLPGYTARIHPLESGGYAVACFARRDPLIDFVLSEKQFLERMKTKLSAEYWISPRFSAEIDYRFPIQSGATRLFGEIKPWAPSFSYGLVIILDSRFLPLTSVQSRANGRRHGITTALEWQGDLFALSKGNGELLKVKAVEQLV